MFRRILLAALLVLAAACGDAAQGLYPAHLGLGTVTPQAAAPALSPSAGTYSSTQSVTMTDTTAGSTIHYTTNGTTPTGSSTTYTGAVSVTTTTTVKAIAVASGFTQSSVTSAVYTITVGAFGVMVVGNHLVSTLDGVTPVQLRGANVSGLEGVPFNSDPWRGEQPNFTAMAAWGMNVVRLPLTESTWLGVCSSAISQGVTPAIYKSTVQTAVTQANAAGLYVILDLHWISVPNLCPTGQNAMADTTYSPTFWSQVAATFKGNPAVLFEMFNEPQGNYPPTTADWNNYLTGGLTSGNDVGINTLISSVRGAGATNIILVDGLNYAATFGNNNPAQAGVTDNPPGWIIPTDSVSPAQIAAVQHPYQGAQFQSGANVLLAKGVPIIADEYGDNTNASTNPVSTTVWAWADPGGGAAAYLTAQGQDGAHFPGISYVNWTWDWGLGWYGGLGYNNYAVIQDASGTPFSPSAYPALGDSSTTPTAYAAGAKAHYLCRKAGTC